MHSILGIKPLSHDKVPLNGNIKWLDSEILRKGFTLKGKLFNFINTNARNTEPVWLWFTAEKQKQSKNDYSLKAMVSTFF